MFSFSKKMLTLLLVISLAFIAYLLIWNANLSITEKEVINFETVEYIQAIEKVEISGNMRFSAEMQGRFKFYRDEKTLTMFMERSKFGIPYYYWKGAHFSFKVPVSGLDEIYYGRDLIWRRNGQGNPPNEG